MRKFVSMRNLLKTGVTSLTLVCGIALCMPDADATDVKGAAAVAYANCHRSEGCKKHINDDGSVQGCKGNGSCFYCNEQQCWWAVPRRLLGGYKLDGRINPRSI